jgi:hypothetical protein
MEDTYDAVRPFKGEVRSLARENWIQTHDKDLAIEMTTEAIKARYSSILVSFLIALLIRVAVELIIYWWKKNFLYPEPTYQFGEPGYED